MTTTPKLTKKQKKSLAFRDRKSGKKSTTSTNDADLLEMDDNAIPAMEDQDLIDLQSDRMEVEGNEDKNEKGNKPSEKKVGPEDKEKSRGKAAVRAEEAGSSVSVGKTKNRKRKRDDEDQGAVVDGVEPEAKVTKKAKTNPSDEKTQRLILFVGNLKYTTTKEAILAHFSAVCDPLPTVRLLTPKAKPGAAATPKSKGCAFLEFETKVPLQQALKLHHSMLDSRMINVELTAGGGGKSELRLAKLRERNKALLTQRKKKVEKGGKSSIPSQPDKPQRYSATSGLEQAPVTKRTWSVGDTVEEHTHRGGQRKQRGNRRPKSLGTGVNAIPVG